MRTIYIITNVSASDWTMFLTGGDKWSNEYPDAAQFKTEVGANRYLAYLQKRAKAETVKTEAQRARLDTYLTAGVSAEQVDA